MNLLTLNYNQPEQLNPKKLLKRFFLVRFRKRKRLNKQNNHLNRLF